MGLISVKPQSSTTCTADEGFRANCMMPLSSVCMTPIQQEQTSSKACITFTMLCGSIKELYTIKQHSDARLLHCAMPQALEAVRRGWACQNENGPGDVEGNNDVPANGANETEHVQCHLQAQINCLTSWHLRCVRGMLCVVMRAQKVSV